MILQRISSVILVVVFALVGCSRPCERNLRIVNPSTNMQVERIQVYLDQTPITGGAELTLGPDGMREYRGIQVPWGKLNLRYSYPGSTNQSEITQDLVAQFGKDFCGTIQVVIISSDEVTVAEAEQ